MALDRAHSESTRGNDLEIGTFQPEIRKIN